MGCWGSFSLKKTLLGSLCWWFFTRRPMPCLTWPGRASLWPQAWRLEQVPRSAQLRGRSRRARPWRRARRARRRNLGEVFFGLFVWFFLFGEKLGKLLDVGDGDLMSKFFCTAMRFNEREGRRRSVWTVFSFFRLIWGRALAAAEAFWPTSSHFSESRRISGLAGKPTTWDKTKTRGLGGKSAQQFSQKLYSSFSFTISSSFFLRCFNDSFSFFLLYWSWTDKDRAAFRSFHQPASDETKCTSSGGSVKLGSKLVGTQKTRLVNRKTNTTSGPCWVLIWPMALTAFWRDQLGQEVFFGLSPHGPLTSYRRIAVVCFLPSPVLLFSECMSKPCMSDITTTFTKQIHQISVYRLIVYDWWLMDMIFFNFLQLMQWGTTEALGSQGRLRLGGSY